MNARIAILSLALVTMAVPLLAAEKSEPASPSKDQSQNLEEQLKVAKKELSEMLTRFTEAHPRVQEQRRKIAQIEAQIAKRKREKA